MAPEQGRGLGPDPRSDLYSAAVVLYYCVTGRLPFEAEAPHEVLLLHVNSPVPDPRTINADLPYRFVEVLFRGLAKDPAQRYQSRSISPRRCASRCSPSRWRRRRRRTAPA